MSAPPSDPRPGWDDYFLSLALLAATRATCQSRRIGSVLVKDRQVAGTGYNGAPAGAPSCLEVGCLDDEYGQCRRTVHAEANLVLHTTQQERAGGTVYCTDEPCQICATILANSGIKRLVYAREFPRHHHRSQQVLSEAGVEVVQLPLPQQLNGALSLPESVSEALAIGLRSQSR